MPGPNAHGYFSSYYYGFPNYGYYGYPYGYGYGYPYFYRGHKKGTVVVTTKHHDTTPPVNIDPVPTTPSVKVTNV